MDTRTRNLLFLVLLFAIFAGPIILAYSLNVLAPGWRPFGGSNNGELLQPAQKIRPARVAFQSAHRANALSGLWTLAYVVDKECDSPCQLALVELRQVKIALGRDSNRLQQMLALQHPSSNPVNLALKAADPDLLIAITDQGWIGPLKPRTGEILLLDPQGFAVLKYAPATKARPILDDLKRLLKISKIG